MDKTNPNELWCSHCKAMKFAAWGHDSGQRPLGVQKILISRSRETVAYMDR